MDIAGSPDIFKAKMSELMRTLEKSEDDLLTKYQVTKASLSDHLDKFNKVRDQGLFLRAPKVTKNREARRYIVKSLNVHMIGPGECTVVSRLDKPLVVTSIYNTPGFNQVYHHLTPPFLQ